MIQEIQTIYRNIQEILKNKLLKNNNKTWLIKFRLIFN